MMTTLNQIRAHRPCHDGWSKLLRGLGKTAADDETLWLDEVLDHNGLDYALWCLHSVEGCDREIRLFAVWCARRVQHHVNDQLSVAVLDFAERCARVEVSNARMRAEMEAAQNAATWAAWVARLAVEEAMRAAAAWAELDTESAGKASASAEARDTERAAQAEELRWICREMREAQP
jgi:chemotaxis protein histidine kinase CheA